MEDRFETFTLLLQTINRSIRKLKTIETKNYELKSPQVMVLYYLYKEEALSAKELADLIDEDKANISRITSELENKSLIYCDKINDKRYRDPFKLTDKGLEVAKFIYLKAKEILELASQGLDDEMRENLYKSLKLINKNLIELCKKDA